MPQTSDCMRALMLKWFGNEIDGPVLFLESHGYVLRSDWRWDKPCSSHSISYEEFQCIRFLIEEWDFGGVVSGPTFNAVWG